MEEIKEFEVGQGTDLSEFNMERTKIAGYKIIDVESPYGSDGNLIPDGSKRPVKCLKVFSEPVTTIKGKDGTEIDIRASELFNMKERDGEWGISNHPEAGIQKLIKTQKVKDVKGLVGTTAIIRAYKNKQGNVFLGFMS